MASTNPPILFGPKKLTKFEKARILGGRALQLSLGAPVLVKLDNLGSLDTLQIAEKELEEGVLPITVVRRTPRGEEIKLPLKGLVWS